MLGLGVGSNSGSASDSAIARSAPFNEYSLLLDGVGDYFDTNYSANDVLDGSFTFSAWVKPDDGIPPATQMIFGGGLTTDYIYLSIDQLGRLVMVHNANSAAGLAISVKAAFTDGAQSAWTHVALSVVGGSGSNTTYQFYVNGSAVTTTTIAAPSSANHAAFDSGSVNLYIGAYNLNGAVISPFKGHIDEFSFHDGVLTSGMITAVYNSGAAIDLTASSGAYDVPDRMKLYYRFENNANDEGSAGSNGALAADALYSQAITLP